MNSSYKISGLCLIILTVVLHSCRKDDMESLINITTNPVSQISRTSAYATGSVINNGTDSVFAAGFCWGLKELPTLADNVVNPQFFKSDKFQCGITGLKPGTTYYLRAYGISCGSKDYGNQVIFDTKPVTAITLFNPGLTYNTVTDIDGNTYKSVQIGQKEWMAENLRTTRFNDGTEIPMVTDGTKWQALENPGYCWYENNESVFKLMYGGYYNFYAVKTGKLCPAGWHVANGDDWKALKVSLGMTVEQAEGEWYYGGTTGDKLKETGTYNWVEGSTNATNESGFTALPSGSRLDNPSSFVDEGFAAGWWSSTIHEPSGSVISNWVIWNRSWISQSGNLSPKHGLGVRCVKD